DELKVLTIDDVPQSDSLVSPRSWSAPAYEASPAGGSSARRVAMGDAFTRAVWTGRGGASRPPAAGAPANGSALLPRAARHSHRRALQLQVRAGAQEPGGVAPPSAVDREVRENLDRHDWFDPHDRGPLPGPPHQGQLGGPG